MNIKFGTDNFYVRYLKRFLNQELQQNSSVLGEFTQEDLISLIKYLKLPNVKNMFEVEKEITNKFPELTTNFYTNLRDEEIIWKSKTISTTASNFLMDNYEDIKLYCKSVGWEVEDIYNWVDSNMDLNEDRVIDEDDRQLLYNVIHHRVPTDETLLRKCDLNLDGVVDEKDLDVLDNYLSSGRLSLSIQKSNRVNYFPNEDMLVFINQFQGSFLYGYSIKNYDGEHRDDTPELDTQGLHKVALYECTPGQKITIAHNSTNPQEITIGSSGAILKQDVVGYVLQNIQTITLAPGESYQYTTTSREAGSNDAHWVCIECESDYTDLAGQQTKTIALDVGDINFDGKIDMEDYHLLASYTAKGPGSEEVHWTPTPKQLAVMNVDETNTGIDVHDAVKLYKFIQGDPSIPSLGVAHYTYTSGNLSNSNYISNFLIVDGHYNKDVNIPFSEFTYNDWAIHEKFFNYLLNMSIHKYSNSDDIYYLQSLLKEYYPDYKQDPDFYIDGVYGDKMKQLVRRFQTSYVTYTKGDLNRDGALTEADLTQLRNYLDDPDVVNCKKCQDFLDGKITLTDTEKAELDVTGDGRVTISDVNIYNTRIHSKYSNIFLERAKITNGTDITEADYTALQNELNGVTDNLKQYQMTFNLGWCDVKTENELELKYNISGNISEVSK